MITRASRSWTRLSIPSPKNDLPLEVPQYTRPVMYLMGRTGALLQGSGRHKRDDTGSPGFEVDQF